MRLTCEFDARDALAYICIKPAHNHNLHKLVLDFKNYSTSSIKKVWLEFSPITLHISSSPSVLFIPSFPICPISYSAIHTKWPTKMTWTHKQVHQMGKFSTITISRGNLHLCIVCLSLWQNAPPYISACIFYRQKTRAVIQCLNSLRFHRPLCIPSLNSKNSMCI